ncbi:hypothetical protein EMIHUDRAFT_260178 [Emiliania huxleyi CCMP1516]|uniref:Uncharacterized protein n=2 Tax=Emiliania huxleyi TaxID=2903 RepID=A0A0D3KWY7_EMIH1|nr:hypothetical protein EMIHUDRAFT_260178 [Emiliania huxleyi CCMP1516]EOD40272.1 hypothetical protein EMIHUDRAFT_260178 [Emiliania huxleyi CCMP1516]|eukprot:XP_005792701.1 hypothetical protein EMIHUDRAFT_260178 [Emiliania huxleyi CCMP1516]
MVTMNGEWYTVPGEPLFDVGGHAVNIVGYNDYYRDEFGNTGGFILRNTWKDGLGIAHGQGTRGSHTARYYNKDLDGANDEPLSCPNPHSPRSWGTCKDLAECKKQGDDPQNKDGLLRLKCTDTGFALPEGACDKDVGYFMANRTEWGMRGLFVTCFIYEGEHGTSQSMCLPPLTSEFSYG